MKCCTKCGYDKPEKDFELRNPVTGARRAQCRQCRNEPGRRGRKRQKRFEVKPADPIAISAAFRAFMAASAQHQVSGGNPPPAVNTWHATN